MPITPSKIQPDPYGRLSWNTSLTVLALRKLSLDKPVTQSERSALITLTSELGLLSKAKELRVKRGVEQAGDPLPAEIRKSFFTLVAIGDAQSFGEEVPDFGKASQVLNDVCQHLESNDSGSLNKDLLENARKVCISLLERLAHQRPFPIPSFA